MKRKHRTLCLLISVIALGAAGITSASANEPISGSLKDSDLENQFWMWSIPQWNFPRANNNDPCWPEAALVGNNLEPADGAGAPPWPDTDKGCAPHGQAFPTYYSVRKCNDNEWRAIYTIYQATSGFWATGHRHDFEHIVVVWTKQGSDWYRDRLLMSTHGKHRTQTWSGAESWNSKRNDAGLGREYPRIFVGFGSHAMFNNQGGFKTVTDVLNAREYRQADYPEWPDRDGNRLIRVRPGDGEGYYEKFKQHAGHFGKADSNPARVYDDMCGY